MNSLVRNKLLSRCKEYRGKIFDRLNRPKVRKLKKHQLIGEKIFRLSVNKLYGNKSNRDTPNKRFIKTENGKQVVLSGWGLLAKLNLKGLKSNFYNVNSVRFGHFEIMHGKLECKPSELKNKLIQAFDKNSYSCLWASQNQSENMLDRRMQLIDFQNTEIIIINKDFSLKEIKNKKRQLIPSIIYVDTSNGNVLEKERLAVKMLMSKRAFILLVKNYKYNNTDLCIGNIILNHEYMDGLLSSLCLNKYLCSLGLEQKSISYIDEDFLQNILDETSNREHYNLGKTHLVKSLLISKNETKEILEIYELVISKLKKYELSVSFEVFFQLLMISELTKEKNIKACTPKFINKVFKQLDLFYLDKSTDVFETLVESPDKIRENFSSYLVKDKYITLFRKNCDVVEVYIEPLLRNLPLPLVKLINSLSNTIGISKASIGQVAFTGVPSKIKLNNELINLGGGFGGPTLASFQDAALTVGFIKDENDNITNIVLRRKYRKEL